MSESVRFVTQCDGRGYAIRHGASCVGELRREHGEWIVRLRSNPGRVLVTDRLSTAKELAREELWRASREVAS